jgi:ubiquinol-cytochrome c reductase cytochrome b subunit
VLWAGAGTDLIATNFKLSLNHVLTSLQVLLIIGPVIAFIITKRACLSLQRKDREIVLHGRETGRVVRLPHGEYIEVHEPLDEHEMWKLVDFKTYQPTLARPNSRGKITVGARVRASLSKFYFEDRIAPVTATELAAAHHDHHEVVEEAPAKKAVAAKKPAAKKAAVKK